MSAKQSFVSIFTTLLLAFISLTGVCPTGFSASADQPPAAPAGISSFGSSPVAKAQMPAAEQPARWPHEDSDLAPDPALVFGKLPNGFRYVLMQNHYPKRRVSMHLDVQIGSLMETDAQRGLAHFLEHLAFDGSRHFGPGEMIKYFQRIGMQFGPDANAHTSFNETVYDILLTQGDEKSLAEGLTVLRDYADGLLLLDSQIDKERKVVLSEMRTRDSADYRTLVETLKFEYPQAKLSRRMPIGTPETLRAADRRRIKDFYDTWYRPDTMVLVMVGEFDPAQARHLITDTFGDMQARAPRGPEVDFGRIGQSGMKAFYHYESEAGGSTVSIENVIQIAKSPDSLALQKKWLLRDLADRIVQNRLDAMLDDPKVPFTSAVIGSGRYLSQIQYAEISADTRPENWAKSLARIDQTLRSALEYGFYPAELERVKKQYLASLDNAVKQAATRDSRELAHAIIRNLNSDQVFQSPQQEKQLYAPIIAAITPSQVHEAFVATWPPEQRLVLVTGNVQLPGGQTAAENQILAAFKSSEAQKAAKPKEIAEIQFPYLPIPASEGKIIQRRSIEDLQMVQIDYANGVRLNLKKTAFKSNEVLVNVAFGRGQASEPKDAPGISDLGAVVVNNSGLGRLAPDELELILSGRQTQVSFRAEEDAFILFGQTVTGQSEFLFQLLQAYLLDPAFRETAYRLALERFKQRYEALSNSVDGGMELFGERYLAGGDSRFGLPTEDRLKAVTLARIRQWIGGALENDPLEVSVVGDFDVHKMVAVVSRYLGSLPARGLEPTPLRPEQPVFPLGGTDRIEVKSQIPKSLVVVAYPTADFWDIARTRRLSALADLFTERLRERIREKMGAAYSFYAFNHAYRAYPGYGVLQAMVSVAPDLAQKVAGAVKEVAARLSSGKISEDELRRVLDPMVNTIKDTRQTNGYWLNTVLTNCRRYPQQLDWSRTMVGDYQAISADELSALAQKYLDNRRAATILILPQGKTPKG